MAQSITVRELEALKPQETRYKVTVDRGLQLRINPNGTKNFIVRYTLDGKAAEKVIGDFGKSGMSLAEARSEAVKIRDAAKKGVDFVKEQIAIEAVEYQNRHGNTLDDLYTEWFKVVSVKRGKRKGRADGGKQIESFYRLYIQPTLGKSRLKMITRTQAVNAISSASAQGKHRSALKTHQIFTQMMTWGSKHQPYRAQLIESDVFGIEKTDCIVGDDFDPEVDTIRRRVLSDDEIIELMHRFEIGVSLPHYIQCAVKIALGCMCRVGELSVAEWDDIDLDAGKWSVRSETTKTKTGITIYFSDWVKREFEVLKVLSMGSRFVFPLKPGVFGFDRCITVNVMAHAVRDRQSFKEPNTKRNRTSNFDELKLGGEKWTMHDLRRTGMTLMRRLGIERDTAHRCMNHTVGNKLDESYDQYDYADEMKAAWLKLGDFLERLVAPPTDNVVHLRAG